MFYNDSQGWKHKVRLIKASVVFWFNSFKSPFPFKCNNGLK